MAHHALLLVSGAVQLLVRIGVIVAGELGAVRLLTSAVDHVDHACSGSHLPFNASITALVPLIPCNDLLINAVAQAARSNLGMPFVSVSEVWDNGGLARTPTLQLFQRHPAGRNQLWGGFGFRCICACKESIGVCRPMDLVVITRRQENPVVIHRRQTRIQKRHASVSQALCAAIDDT